MRTRARNRKGQALLMVTLSIFAVLGMLALAVDLGLAYYYKTAAQTAADSAALASAEAAFAGGCSSGACAATTDACNPPSSTYLGNGCKYALQNFPNGSVTGVSSNSCTPVAGMSAADYCVTFTVSRSYPALFSVVLGNRQTNVAASATASVTLPVAGDTDTCLNLQNKHDVGLILDSKNDLKMGGCGIVVNSDGINGNGSMRLKNGTGIGGAGTISTMGLLKVDGNHMYIHGTKMQWASEELMRGSIGHLDFGSTQQALGAQSSPDPFASKAPPASDGCDYTGVQVGASISNKVTVTSGAVPSLPLPPGTYCGGITIGGSSNVSFAPGTYVLLGGGLTIEGSATVSGAGVSFYNTFDATHPAGDIEIGGSGDVTLSAPTAGEMRGLLVFQDPGVDQDLTINGSDSGKIQLSGSIYLREPAAGTGGAGVHCASSGSLVTLAMVVADNLDDSCDDLTITPDPTGNSTGISTPGSLALVQ